MTVHFEMFHVEHFQQMCATSLLIFPQTKFPTEEFPQILCVVFEE
jgi:hypothetical protein